MQPPDPQVLRHHTVLGGDHVADREPGEAPARL